MSRSGWNSPLGAGGGRRADVGFSRDDGRVRLPEVLGQVLGVARGVQVLEVVHVLGLRGVREPYEIGTVGCPAGFVVMLDLVGLTLATVRDTLQIGIGLVLPGVSGGVGNGSAGPLPGASPPGPPPWIRP